jgi:hypothetical protein
LSSDIMHLILCIEKQGVAMRLEKEGGAISAILRNQLTFWSSHPSRVAIPALSKPRSVISDFGIPSYFDKNCYSNPSDQWFSEGDRNYGNT